MITVNNISKHFGPIKAVDDISFEIQTGEVVGFLGPNGAGKSTTMRMITGYLHPTKGSLNIGGINILDNPVDAQKKIGYLPESVALYPDMIVYDLLNFMGQMRGLKPDRLKERLKAVSNQCQLASVLNRPIGDLSKGFKQRVGLAQALLHDPEILILDEPTIGLDPNQIAEIRQLIKGIGQSKTILLSSHILSEVSATCDRVIIIKKGKIVAQGTPDSLVSGQTAQTSYNIAVRGDLTTIESMIKTLPNFSDLKLNTSDNNLHRIQLFFNGNGDLSEDIFEMAVKNSWKLSHLAKESQSLENVFKDLTQ